MSDNNQVNIPAEYQPLSMWAYFGYAILFGIPCVGFILILVFAFGGAKNINLRNYARSYLCLWIIMIVLVVIMMLVGVGSFVALS